MRRLAAGLVTLAALSIAVLAGSTASAPAQAALIPCFGAPADYIAAFDAVDGTADGAVSYPEPRAFYEAQSHLHPPGELSRHHFEHIHLGMCFPYAEEWKQPNNARTVNVRYVFHHVENYTVADAKSSFVDANNSGGGYFATAAQKTELQAAMDASADSTRVVFQSYTMTTPLGGNCRKTFRPTLNTVRSNADALVDEWFAAAQWTSYTNYPGLPTCTPERTRDDVRSRSWVLPQGGYIYSTIFAPSASHAGDPVPDPWVVSYNNTNNDGHFYIDPDFHSHDPNSPSGDNLGLWHQDVGVFFGDATISIPTGDLPSGWHRLVYIGDRGIHSSIQVIPFYVDNGDTQAPSTPSGLFRVNPTPTSLKLNWVASTDNVGVAGYRVYLDGALYATVITTGRSIQGLSNQPHLLEVEAFDAAGNVSARGSKTFYPPNWTGTP